VRTDGRLPDEIRPVKITRNYTCYAPGSVLIECGKTIVLCTAMIQNRVPRHALDANMGWLTAEYVMLPSSNEHRRSIQSSPGGRTHEIQRLIGRSLRAAVDLYQFRGKTIWIDCNVIQADGGTRTASITGAFVALNDCLAQMKEDDVFKTLPITHSVAAISVGVVDGTPMVDLCADEDRGASVDMNVIMTHEGGFIEVQGTAEKQPFSRKEHDRMLDLATQGIEELKKAQMQALRGALTLGQD
jgi:ribonuclease PH